MRAGSNRHALARSARVICARENHRDRSDDSRQHDRDFVIEVVRHDEKIEEIDQHHEKHEKVREPAEFDEHR